MKRDLLTQLQAWRDKNNRKPLILMGVRQTGKTYLLEHFGANHFQATHSFNFERQAELADIFKKNLDPQRIINELAIYTEKNIDIRHDLVIFDEIQACPAALTSLKYFCEALPALALCSAGSLLGLTLNEGSFPVGKVDMMHLYPLSFKEFLAGIGDQQLAQYLTEIEINTAIAEPIHHKLWERLKYYFITGGLPEPVLQLATHQDNLVTAFSLVRSKREDLINAYYADIAKHSGKINAMHIDRVWRSVPQQLMHTQSGNTTKFVFKDVVPGINRFSRLVDVFDWLKSAELIKLNYIVNTAQIPLSAYIKESQFKCFMFDIGILGAMAKLSPKNILDYDYGTYKGFFAENFVLQELITSSLNPPFNWQEDRAEVEFLLEYQGEITPLEVKSGNITKAKSLQKFVEKYHPKKRIILSARNLKTEDRNTLLQIPLYLAGQLPHLLK